jgi:hypothetical protein
MSLNGRQIFSAQAGVSRKDRRTRAECSAAPALRGVRLSVLGGAFAWRWAVAAERKPLEMVARPLTFIDID